jgi:hypothetical protein
MIESIRSQLSRKAKAKVEIISLSMASIPREIGSVVFINTNAEDFSPFYQS